MRPVAAALGLTVAAAVLAAPSTASADEPTLRHVDGDLVYVDAALQDEDTTRVRGVLREVVVDDARGRPTPAGGVQADRLIVTASGEHVPVAIDAGATALTGSTVVADLVEGPSLERALDGQASAPVPVATATFAEAPTTRAATVAGHRAYVAVVQNSGASVATNAEVEARVDAGLAWWAAESGAAFSRAGRTQRYSSSLPATQRCGFSDESRLWSEAAARFPAGTFTGQGNHLVVVVDDACLGTGVGTLGSAMGSGGSVTLKESAAVFTATLAHELGHNVGLQHANLGAVEYWDLYSPMGLAVSGSGPTALDSEYRSQLGLADGAEIETVQAGTAVTRTLSARGASSGLRGLEVRSGGTSHWVEWRPGTGRDAAAYYPREAGGAYVRTDRKYPQGVTVSTRTTGGRGPTSLRARSSGGVSYGAWLPGQTYTAGAVAVRVDAVTDAGAVVTVANGVAMPDAQPTVASSRPSVSGTPKVGVALRVVAGTWAPGATLTYQWFVDGAAIASARAATYTPTAGARGKRLTVRVTGTLVGHTSASQTSAATQAVASGTLRTAAPRVSGTRTVGRTLAVVRGTWTSGTAFTYRWYVDGTAIKGATRSTYRLTKGTKGTRITVKVTGRKAGYTTVTRTSARTGKIAG